MNTDIHLNEAEQPLQEESLESNTQVAINEEQALNELTEPLNDIVDNTEDWENGTLGRSEEHAVRSSLDPAIVRAALNPEEATGKYIDKLIPLKVVTHEEAAEIIAEKIASGQSFPLSSIKMSQEYIGNNITNTDEPENQLWIDSGNGNPTPATELVIKEVFFRTLVDKLLYAASCGAVLDKRYAPQLQRVAFYVKLLIPTDSLHTYLTEADKVAYNEEDEYNDITVAVVDQNVFISKIMELGKMGAILTPKKLVINTPRYTAQLSSFRPVKALPPISVGADTRLYTRQELMSLGGNDLALIASWYKIKGKGKPALITAILTMQDKREKKQEGLNDEDA